MGILKDLGVGERSRRLLRGDVERDLRFSLFLSLSLRLSPLLLSSLVFVSVTLGLSAAKFFFFWWFFRELLEREESESELVDEFEDDLDPEELLDDLELELLLPLLLEDRELRLEELSLLDDLEDFFLTSLLRLSESFLSLLSFTFDSSPAFRSFLSVVSLSGAIFLEE